MSTSNVSLYRLITEAINDFMRNGYSQRRMEDWLERISIAAETSLLPMATIERMIQQKLLKVFTRATSNKQLFKVHKGISPYTLASIKPKLHSLLEQRIRASVDLIKLNREESQAKALRRLAGWMSSVPATGIPSDRRVKTRKQIRRGVAGLSYRDRLVANDQAQKLVAAVNEIVAVDGGAIAALWHSHWRETGYDFRPSHKARDERVYVIRGNWAMQKGLIRLAGREYSDEITQPAEEVNCRCFYQFLYALRDLPADMLTERGRSELQRVRAQIESWKAAA